MSYRFDLNDKVLVWPDVSFNDNHWIIYIQVYKGKQSVPIKKEWIEDCESHEGLRGRSSLKDCDLHGGLRGWNPLADDLISKYSVLSWKTGSNLSAGKKETVISEGKQGRNVLQQAISEVEHKYKKQKEKHDESRIPPMLLKVYDDCDPSYFENIDTDWYCQRKYNGVRTMARYNGKISLYSRKLHSYNVPIIEEILLPYLKNHPNIIIDGELYMHKIPLQITSGIVRGSDIKKKEKLTYVMFDLFDLDHKLMPFSERFELLAKIFKGAKSPLIVAPTHKMKLSEINKYYKEFLSEEYEGLILRRDGPYQPSYHGKLSDMAFKHKPLRTDEFKIIGFTQGKGKDAGLVVWICETSKHIEFSVRPKMSNKDRRAIYNQLKRGGFSQYKGKPMTIQYDTLSIDGVPQQPRALLLRTYE